MVWPAVIAAAGAVGASLIGASGQRSANKKNISLAQDNRQWQENMSNTEYQRSMRDMRKAGLNPMLAYSKGGASTPSGSVATAQNAAPDFSKVVSSAQHARRLSADLKAVEANTKKTIQDEKLARMTTKLTENKIYTEAQNQIIAGKTWQQIEALTKGISYDNALKEADALFYGSEAGQKLRNLQKLTETLGLRKGR
jgi:hypothetical protein